MASSLFRVESSSWHPPWVVMELAAEVDRDLVDGCLSCFRPEDDLVAGTDNYHDDGCTEAEQVEYLAMVISWRSRLRSMPRMADPLSLTRRRPFRSLSIYRERERPLLSRQCAAAHLLGHSQTTAPWPPFLAPVARQLTAFEQGERATMGAHEGPHRRQNLIHRNEVVASVSASGADGWGTVRVTHKQREGGGSPPVRLINTIQRTSSPSSRKSRRNCHPS